MNIWFTSDTHFGSQRTLKLSKRPFESVEEMDKTMIENWNKVVKDNDIVYHLGDFGNYEIGKELNGRIILLFGNYERKENPSEKILLKNFATWIKDNSFKFKTTYNDKILKYNLVHEPLKSNSDMFNLFGHIHKLCMVKPYGLNVGVDCHNFAPIDLDTVLFYHNAILNCYDDEVFE